MSAKVVQLVSSGFFGPPQRISSVAHAAKLLGLETLKAIFVSASAFQSDCENNLGEDLQLLAAHSFAVAEAARGIAETLTDDRALIGDAYLAGVLHEVGRLALTRRNDLCCAGANATRNANGPNGPSPAADTNKAEPDPGGYLAALWGLSDPVVQAIAYHRIPSGCPEPSSAPLTAVHVAHAFLERPKDAADEAVGPLLDMAYLRASGCAEHVGGWREKCRTCHSTGVPQ
jgi:HD-like signal output (HDOD) protein